MARNRTSLLAALALSLSLSPAFAGGAAERPSTWAVAVAAKSIGNFYRIEPDFYRSGRPGAEGLHELQALGVKSVLDVESPADAGAARGSALKLFHVPMSAFGLHDDRVLEALRIMADPANRPIVIHCHHGADRTGAMVALYRVVVQGWSKQDAVREMNEGGYHHSSLWRNLDRYVLAANVDALRKELKIVKPSATLAAALAPPAPVLPAAAVPVLATAVAAAVPGAPAAALPASAPVAAPAGAGADSRR